MVSSNYVFKDTSILFLGCLLIAPGRNSWLWGRGESWGPKFDFMKLEVWALNWIKAVLAYAFWPEGSSATVDASLSILHGMPVSQHGLVQQLALQTLDKLGGPVKGPRRFPGFIQRGPMLVLGTVEPKIRRNCDLPNAGGLPKCWALWGFVQNKIPLRLRCMADWKTPFNPKPNCEAFLCTSKGTRLRVYRLGLGLGFRI